MVVSLRAYPVHGESHIRLHAKRMVRTKGTRITQKWLYSEVQGQTDNACLFYMANEKTRRSSKSADLPSVIMLTELYSIDTQRTDATSEN